MGGAMKEQVARILNDKIARICRVEYIRANPKPVPTHKQPRPYSVPQEAREMIAMLGRLETASNEELEEMAAFAGGAGVLQMAYPKG